MLNWFAECLQLLLSLRNLAGLITDKEAAEPLNIRDFHRFKRLYRQELSVVE